MASVTYSFTDGTTASATEVNQNFTDLVNQFDVTTGHDHDGTDAKSITTLGTLTTLDITTSSATTIGLDLNQSNASATGAVLDLDNDGTGHGLNIHQDGVQASSKYALYVQGTVAQVNSPLVFLFQDHASSDQVVLQLGQDGTGAQIMGEGNENLSNLGVWTDRTSLFEDKEGAKELAISGYIDKLKAMKMYSYQKKCEVYGNPEKTEEMKDGKKIKVKKYAKVKKHSDARTYIGYILDDTSTPEELISRNFSGEIDGMSGTQNANFLMAVCKELISRLEVLESA